MIPEEHASMPALLEHLEPYQVPRSTHVPSSLTIAPAVQAIIVNCVSIVEPQLAPIIRDNAEMVMARPEDSHSACPTHSEVVFFCEPGPFAACVAIIHDMPPTSHVWFARVQVFAPTTLSKVEGVLPEETMAISDGVLHVAFATCAHNSPSVSSIGTSVPEQHPCMTTTLKHLQSHKTPATTKTPGGFPVAPAMQAIVIDCVPVVYPQLAAIIGDDAEPVIASLEDPQTACPTRSEVIAAGVTWPSATCIAIVHIMFPASHVGPAAIQVLATATLTKVEHILPEQTMAIRDWEIGLTSTTCTHNSPAVSSIRTMVPEEHASVTAALEHLKSDHSPASSHMRPGLSIAPAVQAIVVNCVAVVDP
jgi:hypothetical protein